MVLDSDDLSLACDAFLHGVVINCFRDFSTFRRSGFYAELVERRVFVQFRKCDFLLVLVYGTFHDSVSVCTCIENLDGYKLCLIRVHLVLRQFFLTGNQH